MTLMTSGQQMHSQPTLPGLYQHVPFEQYLSWPYLSQSVLKAGRASMAHLKSAIDDAQAAPTDAMLLGSALHCAFLEPEDMPERVVKWPAKNGSRKGPEWDAFKKENASRIILTEGMHQNLIGMVRALRTHPEIKRWLGRIESTEVSAVGEIEGVTMKARGDALTADPLIDIKSVADASRVERQAYDLGYYLQAAIHTALLKRDRFILATVESTPPHDVVLVEISPAYIRYGMNEAVGLLQAYKHCKKCGQWPGRSQHIEMLDVPEWIVKRQLTQGGQPLAA